MAEPKKSTTDSAPQAAQPTGSPEATNVMAIVSLVLGIISFISGLFFAGLLFGIPAIILGIIGMKKPGGKGMGIAGIVLGAIGSLVSILVIIFWVVGIGFLGQAAKEAEKSATSYQNKQQEVLDSKKEFSKGETAVFDDLEIQARIVNSNYVPSNIYSRASDGEKYIVVNVSVTNKKGRSTAVSSYSFKVEDENGELSSPSFTKAPGKAFSTTTLADGGTTEGQIVYSVDEDSKEFKLVKEDYVYNFQAGASETVKFSLEL